MIKTYNTYIIRPYKTNFTYQEFYVGCLGKSGKPFLNHGDSSRPLGDAVESIHRHDFFTCHGMWFESTPRWRNHEVLEFTGLSGPLYGFIMVQVSNGRRIKIHRQACQYKPMCLALPTQRNRFCSLSTSEIPMFCGWFKFGLSKFIQFPTILPCEKIGDCKMWPFE